MSDDIDQYIDSIAKAARNARRRLAVVLCVSTLLHGSVLLLQAGDLVRHPLAPSYNVPAGRPAPITIRLAPFKLQPAYLLPVEKHTATLAPTQALSPAVADTGVGNGEATENFADENVSVPVELGLPAPNYFDNNEVSIRAKPLGDIDFDLPDFATVSGDGRIVLFLYINESGYVDKAAVELAEPGERITNAVAGQFSKAVFEPARINDQPVKSRLRVEIVVRPLLKR